MNRQISMTEKKISVPLKIVIFKKRKKRSSCEKQPLSNYREWKEIPFVMKKQQKASYQFLIKCDYSLLTDEYNHILNCTFQDMFPSIWNWPTVPTNTVLKDKNLHLDRDISSFSFRLNPVYPVNTLNKGPLLRKLDQV